MRWRIAVPYVLLILAVTLGLTIYVSGQVSQARLANLESQLLADARLLAKSVEPFLGAGADVEQIDQQAKIWSDLLSARVTVIDTDGTVLGESQASRTQMENHLDRPEVQEALAGDEGRSTRLSRSTGQEMMYVAYPVIHEGGQIMGIIRVSLPLAQIRADVGQLRQSIVTAGLVAALLAALMALVIAERTAHPIRQLTRAAERMSEGDLRTRLTSTSRDEIGQLTQAFDDMAEQLRDQMATLAEEQGRLQAVLDHMADGVLITDKLGQVELINAATARLFGKSEEDALGRSLAQVVPHHQVIELWKSSQEEDEEKIEAIELSHQDLFLQCIVTPFDEADEQGYLIIFQDLTRIRRLETIRRDFISNISHELRTPLAGLKALVDTLRGGAIKDPPAAKRFLKRMDTEVDTLTQMVQELLELSRIESGQAPLRLEPAPAARIVVPPADRLRPQAERAGLDFAIKLPSNLPPVLADAERAQMVVTNLVHNAVKFTPPGGSVIISAEVDGQEVVFSIKDSGVGIPADDLPRIFERFFKSDRARSGGGTGLGLAIAKHIVQGHGGRIWVESVESRGSTFYFSLRTVETISGLGPPSR
jgi:two-component system phosphate regulon sensor histidine kinase PhoR